MDDKKKLNLPWLVFAGVYVVILAGLILGGTFVSMGNGESYPGNAVQMPIASIIIALSLATTGIGLFCRRNFSRYLFFVIVPWGSIALGSAFAQALWREDAPYTSCLIFVYVPLAFLLSRSSTLRVVSAKDDTWVSRGSALLLACTMAMFLVRLAVVDSKPSGGGSSLYDMYNMADSLNEYVKRLVLCDVPLWNYAVAFIAVSIPIRFKPKGDSNISRNTDGASTLYMASQNGHVDIVKQILKDGAEVNIDDKRYGATPLWIASGQGHDEIVKLLLEAGANVNARLHRGGKKYTPLSIAKKEGHREIVRLLKEYGAID